MRINALTIPIFIEVPVEADVVTGVPDSSISVAIGYAEASGIPYEMGLIKNKYVGRTFIHTIALIVTSIEKFATEIRGLQKSETREVEEFSCAITGIKLLLM